ncbi:hypothetical protein TNIN_331881 [Trichonephila inaurata madagascariensis]|uniref:Uncharacterized protein n=1 Tax=Trichonephila inaurata madagascariensis TaxID=2747483 RepID=A0A8X6YVC2_9ARAC|nr:hypothetical protein TNIN_331881 [Trichonephila inaurata madagascariensis]
MQNFTPPEQNKNYFKFYFAVKNIRGWRILEKEGAELHPVRSGSSSQTISGMEDEEQTIFFGSGGGFRTKNAPTVFRMQQTHFGRAVASLPFLSPGQPIGEIRCHDVTTCGTRTS